VSVIGIDPGLSGGLARIAGDNVELVVMPVVGSNRKGRTGHLVDPGALTDALEDMMISPEGPVHVYLEAVHAMPKMGVAGAFKFGRTVGVIEGILAALEQPYTLVTPQAWQKVCHAGCEGTDPKVRSAIAVRRLFPTVSCLATDRSKVAHAGLVDALLIAEYGRRQNPEKART
jgi:crossover junction endodeoxyribonuclease RuvC